MFRKVKKQVLITLSSMCFLSSHLLGQSTFNMNLDYLRKAVVFLHVVDKEGKTFEVGTGFLMVVPTKTDPTRVYIFLVTARHMADPAWTGYPNPLGTLIAVFNKKAYDPSKDATGTFQAPVGGPWFYPDDAAVDIAIAPLNPLALKPDDLDTGAISVKELPTPEELKAINSGAQIASAGLLVGTAGLKRNYPVFKFGYVSSVPDELIPVGCAQKGMREWLLAASLVGGNSGSPIYFVPVGFPGLSMSNQQPFLLGVQSSSFDGADVAGMAPSSYILEVLRKMNLPDADLLLHHHR